MISSVPASATGKDLMQAAVVTGPNQLECHHVPLPQPQANEVRVAVTGCGVCASNLPPWEGRPWFNYPMKPGQLGHEAWGVVDAVGEAVEGIRPGHQVAFMGNHGYAQFDVASADQVVVLPQYLHDMPFPGEPLGCAMNIFDRSDIQPGQTLAIVGIGFLGALLTQLASHEGVHVVAISRRSCALDLAGQIGASTTLHMDEARQVIEHVRDITAGLMCDRVIEATGKQEGLDLATALTRERGRLIVAGYHQDGPRQVDMQLWNWRGLDVINAHERDPRRYVQGIRAAIRAISEGRLDPTPLYTHHYPLDQLDAAFQAARQRPDGFMKALVLTRDSHPRLKDINQC
jgi:threonine dehydrogenase-like Zn-dependent dehydrogenase